MMTPRPSTAESHVLVRDVLARVAAYADTGTVEDYLACFTEDALWQLAAAEGLPIQAVTLKGRDELRASVVARRAAGVQGPGSHTTHQVSSTHVTFEGDEAVASSLFLFYTGTNETPVLAGLGRYTDTLSWNGSTWRLRSRVITRD